VTVRPLVPANLLALDDILSLTGLGQLWMSRFQMYTVNYG